MNVFSNILDPIRDTLDPDVFDDAASDKPRLKATVASWVKNKVYNVLQANGYSGMEEWLSLVLTGSLTTYQWAEDSDLDVSFWCSLDKFEEFDRAALIAIVLEQLDGHIVPGTTHPLQVFVVDVTQVKGYSDSYQPGVRSAYDLDKMEWMVPPERARVHEVKKEFPDVFNSALQAASKMRSLLQYQPESARAYWKYLHKRRRSDMKAGRGDYSDSNIVYKMLHNAGLFDTIQKELGVHIARAVFAESNMVDVEDIPADQDPLAAAAGNTLVGPSIAPKGRPSGPVRKSHDSGEPHIHFEDLEDEFGDEPIVDVPDDIRGIENLPTGNEDAEAKYDAYAHDDQNIPNPMTLEEVKAHFKKHHGMDVDLFKQMMPDQFAQMTGGYDLAANPDIEEEIFRAMHGETHNPESPYSQMMKWNHAHGDDGLQAQAKVAQMQPLSDDHQMDWLDLVLYHDLSVDEIPTDLHNHPTKMRREDLPAHVLKAHGYIPNAPDLEVAHEALHTSDGTHSLRTQEESN